MSREALLLNVVFLLIGVVSFLLSFDEDFRGRTRTALAIIALVFGGPPFLRLYIFMVLA